jgi:hypothetical protein
MALDFSKPAPKPETLEECHELIDVLWKALHKLTQKLSMLEQKIEDFQETLNINSKNSSRPPSSDFVKKKEATKNPKRKSKKKRLQGGQPGHKGKTRELLAIEAVDHINKCFPEAICECGGKIICDIGHFKRHQVHELPIMKPIVTEFQIYHGKCDGTCGEIHTGQLPAGVSYNMLGSLAMAKVATLTGSYRLSKRNVAAILNDFYGLSISIGTVSNAEKIVSEALISPVEAAKQYVKETIAAKHADETSHKEKNKRMWTWVGISMLVCVFLIRASRSTAVAKELLGESFRGVLNSDRYAAYNWIAAKFRQICWSHLQRDFKKISERTGASRKIGRGLLVYCQKMFTLWHRVKEGKLSRKKFKDLMKPIRRGVEFLLKQGACCGHKKTERTCKNILKIKQALWTFVSVLNVEPTNNLAEQLIRTFVIWRKTSFGTQSSEGSRYMERILSVVATCRMQKRNVLDFISQAVKAHFGDGVVPSLIPIAIRINEKLPLAA